MSDVETITNLFAESLGGSAEELAQVLQAGESEPRNYAMKAVARDSGDGSWRTFDTIPQAEYRSARDQALAAALGAQVVLDNWDALLALRDGPSDQKVDPPLVGDVPAESPWSNATGGATQVPEAPPAADAPPPAGT